MVETHEQSVKRGKRSRKSGGQFELRVRKDLEEKGWTVAKWPNNVDLDNQKIIPAKHKFRGKGIPMAMCTGFPDFIAFKSQVSLDLYEVIGVECKTNGYLDKEEQEKCRWLLDNNVFSGILIAEKKKVKNRIVIKYHEFKEKYGDSD